MFRLFLSLGLVFSLISAHALAHDNIPALPQKRPIALTNGRIYTVSGSIIERGSVIIDNGIISALGADLSVPLGAEIFDCTGKNIYPGFIAPYTTLGLVEVEAVRATRDMAETGSVNPNAKAETAFNPESEILPTIRFNGILMANICPVGGVVSGTASLMMLDGWNKEDMTLKSRTGLCVEMPWMGVVNAWWMNKSADEQTKENKKQLDELYRVFDAALAYSNLSRHGLTPIKDIRMEGMRSVFEQKTPVFINAVEYRQILEAVHFAKKYDVRVVIVGGRDAWQCTAELNQSKIPVIIPRVHSLPSRDEEEYDAPYLLASRLAAAGVQFAFSDNGAWQQRNLAYQAGTAMAFGLSENEALKGLTLYPAQMLGIGHKVGSIELGKEATLFVCSGNALDARTAHIEFAFVQGRSIPLESKQTRLANKYRERYRRMK